MKGGGYGKKIIIFHETKFRMEGVFVSPKRDLNVNVKNTELDVN